MKNTSQKIAVIGMSAILPESPDINQYWALLSHGKSALTHFSKEQLLASGVCQTMIENPNYIPVKGYLKNADKFDARAFGVSFQEATLLDPQYRIFLELVDQALFSAGYEHSQQSAMNIGIFASCGNLSDYSSVLENYLDANGLAKFNQMIHTQPNFLPMYVAYRLNFTGPAISIQTACSSSLVAVIQACESVLSGFCELAVAGGVSITLPLVSGYLYEKDLIYARDGQCLPFSTGSSGIVPGDGGGAVLLKRLDKAIEDGDHIYATIEGYHINNDGRQKMSYAAPGYAGQRQVITAALQKAQIYSDKIRFIEAHGTGTKIGDQIELEALKSVFTDSTCYISSVKSTIGHLDVAAGIAGFLKVLLSFDKGYVPPMYGVTSSNLDCIALGDCLDIHPEALAWTNYEPEERYAGISAFGIGGTNAHVILKQCCNFSSQSSRAIPVRKYMEKKRYWPDHPHSYVPQSVAFISQRKKAVELDDIKEEILITCRQFFDQQHMNDYDDFIAYGLNSLASVELAACFQKTLGCYISPQKIFESGNVERLTDYFFREVLTGPRLTRLRQGTSQKTAIVFIHPGHGEVNEYKNLLQFVTFDKPVFAIENNIFNDMRDSPKTLVRLASGYVNLIRNELRAYDNFILCGWSFGGSMAVEIASQLHEKKSVESILLFDAWRYYNPILANREMFIKIFDKKIKTNSSLQYIQNWLDLHWRRAKLLVEYTREETLSIPCVLFKANQLEEEYQKIADPYNHWKPVFGDNLKLLSIEASHSTMFNSEVLSRLAEIFQNELDDIFEEANVH